MIIDTHLHIGNVIKFNLTEDMLISYMDTHRIDFGLVSNVEAIEYDFDQNPVFLKTEFEANRVTRDVCKKYPDRLKGLFWIKPVNEYLDDNSRSLILDNPDVFVGLKMHPFHSKLRVTDNRYYPYMKFAETFRLPIASHTCIDGYSDCKYLAELAESFPDIPFIAVHMNLRSDYEEAAELISSIPNLYGDTTWVTEGVALEKIITKCGSEKILFGTDAPIDGVDTFLAYTSMLKHIRTVFDSETVDAILYKNAIRLFKLEENILK